MGDRHWQRDGGCRCHRLRFRASAAPLLASACHCTGCQRMTGSAFSLTTTIVADAFVVVAGDPVLGGIRGAEVHHYHCDFCKSWVFTRPVPDMGFVNVRTTMFDDSTDLEPFLEVFTAERLPWASTPAVRSYAGAPAFDEYEGLLADYAARQG